MFWVSNRLKGELVAKLHVGVLQPIDVVIHDRKGDRGSVGEPSCWVLVPTSNLCFCCWDSECSSDPVSSIASCNDANVLCRRTDICSLRKLCRTDNLVENLLYLRELHLHSVWKLSVERNNVLFASTMKVVDKLNFFLVFSKKVSHCTGFRLWECTLASVVICCTFLAGRITLTKPKAIIPVEVDSSVSLTTHRRVNVHVRSFVQENSVFIKVILYKLKTVNVNCWYDIVLILQK